MSVEKNLERARLWLETAQTDLDASQVLKDKEMFALACFHAQQAGEKAIKALWYASGRDPWGHSIRKLIGEFSDIDSETVKFLVNIKRNAMVLDRYYIGTRYPDGLPDITPDEVYGKEDADEAVTFASEIVEVVHRLIE